jgi:dihydrofolate reductase
MGKLTVITFITLDNVVEDPHLWSFEFNSNDDASPVNQVNLGTLREADALLLGRVTYEGFAAAWPSRSGDEYSDRLNTMRKYVVSNTLESADWQNSQVVSGEDQLDQVRALKADQNLLVWGSGTLTAALAGAGLVDEYVLLVSPIFRREGKQLFEGSTERIDLRLTDVQRDPAGMFSLRFAAAGA